MATRLHHERLEGPTPATATLLLTHGIFGAGGNWRSVARAVIGRRPEWSALLVDLRQHGRSDAGEPPHTVAACAADLAALIEADNGPPVRAALGHSFGGKVVMALRGGGADLAQTWILDSTPSARPGAWDAEGNDVRDVWNHLVALDRVWARRDDFTAALRERGLSSPLAVWLAMSLTPTDGDLRLRFDLPAIRTLLLDYYATDLWPALTDPALAGDVQVVVAARSRALDEADRARLTALPPAARVHTHVLDTGHWLHLEATAALVDLIATHLPAPA